jgi:hypothetical protein
VPLRPLRVAAAVELASLVLLLLNLATVHWAAVASLLGPTHGCAYLLVIALTFRSTASARVRETAWIPGIGGVLVLRQFTAKRSPVR